MFSNMGVCQVRKNIDKDWGRADGTKRKYLVSLYAPAEVSYTTSVWADDENKAKEMVKNKLSEIDWDNVFVNEEEVSFEIKEE